MATAPITAQNTLPGHGYLFTAPVGTAQPIIAAGADLLSSLGDFEPFAEASGSNNVSITRTGGDRTVISTWARDNARVRYAPVTYGVTIPSVTNSLTTLKSYFGGGTLDASGTFHIPKTQNPPESALLIVVADETAMKPIWFPRTSIFAAGDAALPHDALLEWSLTATILDYPDSPDYGTLLFPELASV